MDDGLYFVHIFKQSRTMDYGRQNTQFLGFWGTKDGCFRKFHMCFRPKKLKKHKNMTFFLNLKIVNSCCRLTKELANFSFYVHQYCESKRLFKILFCVLKSMKNRPFVHQGNIWCTKDGTRPKDVLKDKYDLTRRMGGGRVGATSLAKNILVVF